MSKIILFKGYSKKIFGPECNTGFEWVYCIARLNADIGDGISYLNAELEGGYE